MIKIQRWESGDEMSLFAITAMYTLIYHSSGTLFTTFVYYFRSNYFCIISYEDMFLSTVLRQLFLVAPCIGLQVSAMSSLCILNSIMIWTMIMF